eukprot:Filipodium_phascolosomae@DN2107_c0_g1_i2.p1
MVFQHKFWPYDAVPVSPRLRPYRVRIDPGKVGSSLTCYPPMMQAYLWCACGRSAAQPFCDGSHHGTGIQPVIHHSQGDAYRVLSFCGCKITNNVPFCDAGCY